VVNQLWQGFLHELTNLSVVVLSHDEDSLGPGMWALSLGVLLLSAYGEGLVKYEQINA